MALSLCTFFFFFIKLQSILQLIILSLGLRKSHSQNEARRVNFRLQMPGINVCDQVLHCKNSVAKSSLIQGVKSAYRNILHTLQLKLVTRISLTQNVWQFGFVLHKHTATSRHICMHYCCSDSQIIDVKNACAACQSAVMWREV